MTASQPESAATTTTTTPVSSTANEGRAASPVPLQSVQPGAAAPMDPQKPHAESEETMGLRGGERGRCCPGRFCFCIPCPLPCDFCII
ncbi:hypothetical protein F4780DRAFT_784035 [Xylariomycetidae sp. FL0641]|nr:hypothetical protein F4780DRAFT_784035 [Xylariomycetidae sp. FL0641]